MMTKEQVAVEMAELFQQLSALREAGQKEYVHADANAFANFERVAERISLTCPCGCNYKFNIPREAVLMVYMEKHLDGIHAHIGGHQSQREPVSGRIKDAIVYLNLLYCMEKENNLLQVPEVKAPQSHASLRFDAVDESAPQGYR